MNNLHQVRDKLQQIIEEAAADLQARETALMDLEARERAIANVLECRTMAYQDQIHAAFRDGMQHQRLQMVALISAQLDQWKPGSQPANALNRLLRMING